MKKNLGDRPRPIVRTPEQQRKHRAEQAARAILAGRNREANWARIGRALPDFSDADRACSWAHGLGLATIPAYMLDEAFPAPVVEPTVEEIGVLVVDPIFGEVLEIELDPIATESAA